MTTDHEHQLRRALQTQAERGAPSGIEFDSVTATARGIRRRRTALAAFSTAAVVALAVPAGLALTGTGTGDDGPPVAGQGPSEKPIEAPTGRLVEVSLLDDLETGGAPAARPLLREGTIVSVDGEAIDYTGSGTPFGLHVLGDGWLVFTLLAEGGFAIETVDAAGEVGETLPARSEPAVSDDGTVAAYVAPGGAVHTISTRDGDREVTTPGEVEGLSEVVAIEGSQSCDPARGAQCSILAERGRGGVVSITSAGTVEELADYVTAADVSDGSVLGMVSADDFGSCSALGDPTSGGQVWRTCDNSFGKMSPDGRYAFGFAAYVDGLGPNSVSIVDMADGREAVRFADSSETMTTVFDVVWESDTAVLLTLWDGEDNRWRLLRAGIDGSLVDVDAGLEEVSADPTVEGTTVFLG